MTEYRSLSSKEKRALMLESIELADKYKVIEFHDGATINQIAWDLMHNESADRKQITYPTAVRFAVVAFHRFHQKPMPSVT